jgi:hypothetical protein
MCAQSWKRPPKEFAEVPLDAATGTPLNVADSPERYDAYLNWLADYLYRPSEGTPKSAILPLEAAWKRVSQIESEIAWWIWEHPFDDYPPDKYQARHADMLHRVELSLVLSCVPAHADRRELLHRFYRELADDMSK